jgi:hypothetical protein
MTEIRVYMSMRGHQSYIRQNPRVPSTLVIGVVGFRTEPEPEPEREAEPEQSAFSLRPVFTHIHRQPPTQTTPHALRGMGRKALVGGPPGQVHR